MALVCVGFALCIFGNYVSKRLFDQEVIKDPAPSTATTTLDVISLQALSELTRSNNIQLQESAIKILLDRAMSLPYLTDIISATSQSSNPLLRRKALATIQQLTKEPVNRKILCKLGILKILVDALHEIVEESTQRYIIVALYRLVSNDDRRKIKVVKYGLLAKLIEYLYSSPTHNNDTKYWSLLLVHQFSLTEEIHAKMVSDGLIVLLGNMARLTFGNSQMQKLCLHSLVRLISSMENTEGAAQLIVLYNLKMVPLISCCLRNDDMELVSWAIFLMHEFVIKDVARQDFCELKGLLRVLLVLLGEDSCIPRIILRSLKCLGLSNTEFQQEMISSEVVKKTVPFLKSNDDEAQYWALSLLHDLIFITDSHKEFLENKGLQVITTLCIVGTPSVHVALYIADILVYLCGSAHNHPYIIKSDIIEAVLAFVKMDDQDVQYGGVALLLNLATISHSMIESMIESDAIETLVDLVFSSPKDSIQSVCAKTLTAISKKMPSIRAQILSSAIMPLVSEIIIMIPTAICTIFVESLDTSITLDNLSPRAMSPPIGRVGIYRRNESCDKDDELPFTSIPDNAQTSDATEISINPLKSTDFSSCKRLIGYIDALYIFLHSDVFDIVQLQVWRDEEDSTAGVKYSVNKLESILQPQLSSLVKGLLDILVLPLLNEDNILDAAADGAKNYSTSKLARSKTAEDVELVEIKDELSYHVTILQILLEENVFTVLVSLIQEFREGVTEQALIALAMSSSIKGIPKSSLLHVPFVFTSMIKYCLLEAEECSSQRFYGEFFIQHSVIFSDASNNDDSEQQLVLFNKAYAMLNVHDKTPSLLVTPNRLEIRNDSWTFESIRANTHVTGCSDIGRKFAFEIVLCSDGIIQVGWATEQCAFDPEAGTGVGDDGFSYAFDGHRMRKWHGISPKNNGYGNEWGVGDVVTSLIDLDKCEIAFMKNGVHLGVAFSQVNSDLHWYPAISLASNQGCRVRFGDLLDPILNLPDGYLPISALVDFIEAPYIALEHDHFSSTTHLHTASPDSDIKSTASTSKSEISQIDNSYAIMNVIVGEFADAVSEKSSPTALSISGYEMVPKADGNSESPGVISPNSAEVIAVLSPTSVNSPSISINSKHSASSSIRSPISMNITKRLSLPSVTQPLASPGSTSQTSPLDDGVSCSSPRQQFDLSFYFEMQVGVKGLLSGRYPQFGLTDRGNVTFMMLYKDGMCYFVASAHDPMDGKYYDKTLIDFVNSGSEKHVLLVLHDTLREGDTLGAGVCLSENMIVFTRNGIAIAAFQHDEIMQRLFFPCVRNIARIGSINFGQSCFVWGEGDGYTESKYLDRP